MEMDNLSSVALAAFGMSSAFFGYFLWSLSNQIQASLSSIKDLDHSNPILKAGEKVILSGLISCTSTNSHVTPTQSPFSHNRIAIQILVKETLNRCKEPLSLKSYKSNALNFTIGSSLQIPVNVLNTTIIKGQKTYEKLEFIPINWKQSLRSFSKNFEFFTKFSEYLITDKSIGFVQGEVFKDKNGNLAIKASEISYTPYGLLNTLREKKSSALKLFLLSFLGFLAAWGYKKCRNVGNTQKTKIKCRVCNNPANVVLKPCMHFNLCRKCLFFEDYCKDCAHFVTGFLNVGEVE